MIALEFKSGFGPGHLAKAVVHLGQYSERVLVDLSIWDKRQYLDHWRAARSACIERQRTVTFCDSRDLESLTLWIGHLQVGYYRFINSIVLADDVVICDNIISLALEESDEDWSQVSFWDVRFDDV